MKRLLEELRLALTVFSWPQYGCLFWGDGHHGDQFGHYESFSVFSEELRANFERWGVREPIVIVGPAWRVRIIQWALRGERPGNFTAISQRGNQP